MGQTEVHQAPRVLSRKTVLESVATLHSLGLFCHAQDKDPLGIEPR